MTMDRFRFQREQAQKYTGPVIDIGANLDPGGLRELGNVISCDIGTEWNGQEYPLDYVFDCTVDVWPFEDNYADLVIFGDIIEHFYPDQCLAALKEAHRVADNVCATVPRDHRIAEDPDYAKKIEGTPKGLVHVHVYELDELKAIFDEAGFEFVNAQVVDYGFVPVGYYIEATRK